MPAYFDSFSSAKYLIAGFGIYIGAAILGKVAGELIITDPIIAQKIHPSHYTEYAIEAIFAVGVVVVGRLLMKWKIKKEEKSMLVEHD